MWVRFEVENFPTISFLATEYLTKGYPEMARETVKKKSPVPLHFSHVPGHSPLFPVPYHSLLLRSSIYWVPSSTDHIPTAIHGPTHQL